MFGWLTKKSLDARVFMCVKEVKWDLENSDGLRRATILVLAQIIRSNMCANDVDERLFSNPRAYNQDGLSLAYQTLEDTRNSQTVQRDRIKKMMPTYAVAHSKNATRGLEVWMCSLGAAIVPGVGDDVRAIWRMLMDSRPLVNKALDQLKAVETMTMLDTGRSDHRFGALSTQDIEAIAAFAPSV
jgi:hypothetical protein